VQVKRAPGRSEIRDDDARLGEAELLRALSHPMRVEILNVLSERVASPVEIARSLGQETNHVAYHTRQLRDFGLIELVDERQVRGATEHFYRAVERPWFDEQCWSQFDPAVKRAVSSFGIDLLIQDAARALKAGTFDSRDSRHLSRASMSLDAEGFAKVGKILDEALDKVLAEQAASDERRRTSKEPGIPTVTAIASFEVPPRGTEAGS
jgi:DNA-binding transcriptional ArsR family regulator